MPAILKTFTLALFMVFSSIFLCCVYIFLRSLSEVFPPVFFQGPISWTLVQTASRCECVSECVSFEQWTVASPWSWTGISNEMKWIDRRWATGLRDSLSVSFFLCIHQDTQNAVQLEIHLGQPTQSKRQRDGKGEEEAESPLKVTEFSMPHITYIPFLLPFQLSNFINCPLLTYKQALNYESI